NLEHASVLRQRGSAREANRAAYKLSDLERRSLTSPAGQVASENLVLQPPLRWLPHMQDGVSASLRHLGLLAHELDHVTQQIAVRALLNQLGKAHAHLGHRGGPRLVESANPTCPSRHNGLTLSPNPWKIKDSAQSCYTTSRHTIPRARASESTAPDSRAKTIGGEAAKWWLWVDSNHR